MAESGFIDRPDTCTVAEALRKYSGNKAWCTRYTNKIEQSQPLLYRQYDRRTDKIVAKILKKAENEVAVMGQIAELLVKKKFEKAKDHQDEVKELEDEVAASWDRYQTNIHAPATPPPPQQPQHLQQPQDAPLLFKILSQWNWCQNWTRHLILKRK